jgi:hypothetical protein
VKASGDRRTKADDDMQGKHIQSRILVVVDSIMVRDYNQQYVL